MADAWGGAWGTSWGVSWGAGVAPAPVEQRPIGGGYRKPKYVRKDGSISDTLDDDEIIVTPELVEEETPEEIVVSPALIAALKQRSRALQSRADRTPAIRAEIRELKAEIKAFQARLREEEDIAVALLLLA